VPHFVDTFGSEKLIFSTDYPHGDSKFPHAVDCFDKLPLSDDDKARIVSSNWTDLYKVPLTKHTPG
jgi:predicted TIM-barrel fold metal-dependent hydrolase